MCGYLAAPGRLSAPMVLSPTARREGVVAERDEWEGRRRARLDEEAAGLRRAIADERERLSGYQESHLRGQQFPYLYNRLTRKLVQVGRREEALVEIRAYEELMEELGDVGTPDDRL